MADALSVGSLLVKIAPAQLQPKSRSQNATPKLGHLFHVELQQLLHGFNSHPAEALFHPSADPGQITWREREKSLWELAWRKGDQSIRFLHVGSDLGQKTVGRQPHGATQG